MHSHLRRRRRACSARKFRRFDVSRLIDQIAGQKYSPADALGGRYSFFRLMQLRLRFRQQHQRRQFGRQFGAVFRSVAIKAIRRQQNPLNHRLRHSRRLVAARRREGRSRANAVIFFPCRKVVAAPRPAAGAPTRPSSLFRDRPGGCAPPIIGAPDAAAAAPSPCRRILLRAPPCSGRRRERESIDLNRGVFNFPSEAARTRQGVFCFRQSPFFTLISIGKILLRRWQAATSRNFMNANSNDSRLHCNPGFLTFPIISAKFGRIFRSLTLLPKKGRAGIFPGPTFLPYP